MAAVIDLELEYDLLVLLKACIPVHGLAEVLDRNNPNVDQAGEPALQQFVDRDAGLGNEPQLAGKASDLVNKPASLYSGAMRLLLQDHYSKCRDTAVPYSYTFQKTHGLMFTSDGAPWIIDVDRTNGIRAIRLEVAGSLTQYASAPSDESAFRFDPVIKALPALADVSWRLLADAPTIWGTLQGAPHYGEGWAFSGDGSKAAIVLVDAQPPYFYTRLYELTFTEADDTIATPGGPVSIKVPAGVTLAVLEEDFLWQSADGTNTRLKHPDGTGVIGVQVHSRDDLSGGQPGPPQTALVAPVYCFYKGAALQVARWHYEAVELTGIGAAAINTWTACYSTPGAGVVNNRTMTGSLTQDEKGQQLSGWMEDGGLAGTNTLVAPGSVVARRAFKDPYAWVRTSRTDINDSTTVEDVLVLPMLDREAMYHARRQRVAQGDTSSSLVHLAWRADTESAVSYRQPYAAITGFTGMDPADQVAILGPTPMTTPFDITGTFTLFPTEVPLAGAYHYTSNGQSFTGDSSAEVAQQVADAWAASELNITSASVAGMVGATTVQGLTREQFEFNFVRTDTTTGTTQSLGAFGLVQVTQSPEAVFGPPGVTPVIPTENNPASSTEALTFTAYLDGSVVSATWPLDAAENDAWQRQTGVLSGQEWLVTQDANVNAHALYYRQPRPEGGTIGQVMSGSVGYTPAARTSQLLAWVGRP